jgi:aminoglycoside phosphotransferase (APT) family kinase protein
VSDLLPESVRSLIAEVANDPGDLQLTLIPGGASRETWLIEAGERRWVLRRDPEGSVSLVPIADEFTLITSAHKAGVPVPLPSHSSLLVAGWGRPRC